MRIVTLQSRARGDEALFLLLFLCLLIIVVVRFGCSLAVILFFTLVNERLGRPPAVLLRFEAVIERTPVRLHNYQQGFQQWPPYSNENSWQTHAP